MKSNFPGSPRILKGALIAYDSQILGNIPNIIVFQYNPERLTRALRHRGPELSPEAARAGQVRRDTHTVSGPPEETINLTVQVSAADFLEHPQIYPHIAHLGLNPILAALELLLYPSTMQLLDNQQRVQMGNTQVREAVIPFVLFVWGKSKVVPVRLMDISITEEAFDQSLNPIQASVELSMSVMTTMELTTAGFGRSVYIASQVRKEGMARLNLLNSADALGGLPSF